LQSDLASICDDRAQSSGLVSEIWCGKRKPKRWNFPNNDINYTDSAEVDHDKFSFGLKKSLFNFMHGICFDYELQDWFEFKIPRLNFTNFILITPEDEDFNIKPTAKIVWLGGKHL
jgi:hypothetical protein